MLIVPKDRTALQGALVFLHSLGGKGNKLNRVKRRIRRLEGEMEGHQYWGS